MKQSTIFLFLLLSIFSCRNDEKQKISEHPGTDKQLIDTADMTNNFYDNTETFALPVRDLVIEGEISNPGAVDFTKLQKHSVIVKEALLDSAGSDRFVGAYRYDGYSLFDILNERILNKENSAEFKPIIDLYIEIENDKGQKVFFSWGEIYYPNNLHRIIIASDVARIVPSKTKDLWPLPAESKIVAGNDLVTERNISSPVRITVRSCPLSFKVDRNMSDMNSPDITVFKALKKADVITALPNNINVQTFNTIFYGRGRGIHSTTPFSGILLKDLIIKYYPISRENLQTGMLCLAGIDGYRCAFSYSEIFNRNDQQEFLLIKGKPGEEGGQFRVFAACDFFSDRAVKSLSEIHMGY
ncbi:MAG: hypothetical protein IPN67_07690 [Bacteroidales bacterium]|nr:hypothetical protein [Bacteroidales bacterium]MBK8882262.1 hypothetical protein [Bacteroidales bacterium]